MEKLRGLKWSLAGSAANIVFVKFTFFSSAFVLFLSALGLSKGQIGVVLSLLPFFGLVALIAAPFVARVGYKRAFLWFWSMRQAATFAVLLTPWVALRFGSQAVLAYITGVVAFFALFRALGETAGMPWRQEYIPNTIRGRFTATDTVITTITGFIAVLVSGLLIANLAGLTGYYVLFALGGLFGLIGVVLYARIPGGAARAQPDASQTRVRTLAAPFSDPNFRRFLYGSALIILAMTPLATFLPLFMNEQVGIEPGNVILLQMGVLLGNLLSSFLWGWAADRYGSKPVMMISVGMRVFLPILYLLIPRHADISLAAALGVSAFQGVVDVGWAIGAGRLLFVGIVPTARKSEYMALHYAWAGLIGGGSQLLGGWLVQGSAGLSGSWLGIPLHQYLPLMVISGILPVLCIAIFRRVRADARYGVGEFAGLFLQGNPLVAMGSLIRYQFARDEQAAVRATERMGESKSLLTVEELLEALADPRFNVRFEAVLAIARMQPDQRLTDALIEILDGTELALSTLAAWALGRAGGERGVVPLRAALDSPYHSIRAHSARALGVLGDHEAAPLLLERLRHETDRGLQMAYAAALGRLQEPAAIPLLLALLRSFSNEGARMELALSLARIVGSEHRFIQLLRSARNDPGTATARAVDAFRKRLQRAQGEDENVLALLDACADALAHDDLDRGFALLGECAGQTPAALLGAGGLEILTEIARWYKRGDPIRQPEALLILHVLHEGWEA